MLSKFGGCCCYLQGPFRASSDVMQQRHKPLQPTLHVETDYDCVDKTRAQLRQQEDAKCLSDKRCARILWKYIYLKILYSPYNNSAVIQQIHRKTVLTKYSQFRIAKADCDNKRIYSLFTKSVAGRTSEL